MGKKKTFSELRPGDKVYHFSFWKTKNQIDIQYIKEVTDLEVGKSIILKTNTHDLVVLANETRDNESFFTSLDECKVTAVDYLLKEKEAIDIRINDIMGTKEDEK